MTDNLASSADTLPDVMTGFNGTLFCYGQTGSGKTYSELLVDSVLVDDS